MPSLFDPITLGAIEAPNRILMAPLTRGRGTRAHVPTPIMVEYYVQRASAGLILTEATGISQEGLGWPYAPGLWSDEQVEAWKPIVDAVHQAGGRIAAQLWHMGRLVHPDFLDGGKPVSSSATTGPAHAHTYDGKQPYAEARPLEADELPRVVADYVNATRNAKKAGFDGVQVHSANGYLLDQFLRANSNHRDDDYGGTIENRTRLLREVIEAVVGEIGADRTGVRFSPNEPIQGVDDDAPEALFGAAAAQMKQLGIAYIELREPGYDGTFSKATRPPVAPTIKREFGGPVILNSDFDGPSGQKALDEGRADAITFGRTFIANPDLPARIQFGSALAQDNMKTWYSQGAEGYTDYPAASR